MPGHYDHRLAQEAMRAGAILGVRRWAEMVLGEAVRETPVDEGTLRGSATILEGEGVPEGEVWIAFIEVYAAYQHEGMRADGTYVIREHPKGGKSKYLEDPVKSHAGELDAAIAAGQRLEMSRRGLG